MKEHDMNILMLSVGTRNKLVEYFKRNLMGIGKVIATDCSKLAPALYDADLHYIVPRIDDQTYLEVIVNICKKNNVKCVLTLIDSELSFLSEHLDAFKEIGVNVIVSDYSKVEMCFDKYKMFQFLNEHKIKTIKSYVNLNEFYEEVNSGIISYPVFVKPIKGSASIHNFIVCCKEELEIVFKNHSNLMIQELIVGTEIGADVYIDMISDKPVAIFTKEKILMRAGETDKSVSFKDPVLFKLIEEFVTIAKFKGIIDIDIFRVDNEYIISEVNPRFGGGYLHAYECGVNIPHLIIENIRGHENKPNIGDYPSEVYMMKYNEVKIIHK